MRIFNDALTFTDDGDLAQSVTSDAKWLGHIANYSIQLIVSGGTAPTGSFTLEASNDATDNAANVSNWATVSSSSIGITDNGTVFWNVSDCGYKWVRVRYTRSSGSGTISYARINGKGV